MTAQRADGHQQREPRALHHQANEVSTLRTRARPASMSAGETAPAERRNQPSSRFEPKAWNGTTAKPAPSRSSFGVSSFVLMPPRPRRGNCTERKKAPRGGKAPAGGPPGRIDAQ